MISRFSPGIDRGNVVPYDIRKEMHKRSLIRQYEDSRLAALLSDKYLKGVCMTKNDWVGAIELIYAENPSKRRRLNEGEDARIGNLKRQKIT